MKSNTIFMALIITIGLVSLWFTGNALYKLYGYNKLNSQILADNIQWSIKEVTDEQFIVEAHYEYKVNGKSYTGDTVFSNHPHRNKWGANEAIKDNQKGKWKVWYDKNDPDYSSLQKNYPYKELIYSVVLWGLVAYFIWLGYYTNRQL